MSKLGKFVVDNTSGVRGYVIAETKHISGFVQHCVQPLSTDGNSMPDAYNIDGHNISVVGGVLEAPVATAEDHGFNCGDIVTSLIPGDFRKMIVTAISTNINGCVQLLIRYMNSKDESVVEVMDNKLCRKLEEPKVEVQQNKQNSQGLVNGAPSSRVKPVTMSRRVQDAW